MLSHNYRTKKIVQCLSIASLVVLSSFVGFLATISPVTAAAGDLTITDDFVIRDRTYKIDGDLRIEPTGTLTIKNATLSFINDNFHKHSIIVNGGTLILDRATITTDLDQIDVDPNLDMFIQQSGVDGATMISTNRSTLKFPGNITISGANTNVILRDTEITSHSETKLTQYYSTSAAVRDLVNDCPTIVVTDSTVEMYDSSILNLPQFPTSGVLPAKNITLTGDAQLTAINCYISVDFKSTINTHNTISMKDQANAYLYGCTFEDPVSPIGRSSAITTESGESAVLVPTTQIGGEDTTSGESVDSLWSENEGLTYEVIVGEIMAVGTFTNGLSSNPSSVTLVMKFSASLTYDGAQSVQYAINPNPYASLNIIPNSGDTNRYETADLYARGVQTLADISNLKISFNHGGSAGNVQFDIMYLVVEVGQQVYIYRWADIYLADEYSVPLPGATISAKFTGSSELEGKSAYYYSPAGILSDPPSNVLSYMGKTVGNYKIADSKGRVLIPYLSDIINNESNPNSLFVGTINFTGTYGINSSSVQDVFDSYPAMGEANTTMSMFLDIENAWATNPDPSRYIIVPENITLSGGTYIHGGDIIVRPGGLLELIDISFTIAQTGSGSRIIVDNGGILRITNSTVNSNLPVSVQVLDGGTVEITNSVLSNDLSIDISGDASVQIIGSVINGDLATAWDSTASLDIQDTVFNETMIFDGATVTQLVNVTAPDITIDGNAQVSLYRWIIVTVLDGTGNPLPTATVTVEYQINGTVHGVAVTDETGIVGIKALASVLQSSVMGVEETYYGNYKVSAVYTYGLDDYDSTIEKIALINFTMPLTESNALLTLDVPDALPDLDPPINLDPDPPLSYAYCTISTTITNSGVVDARNVLVYFYDSADNASFTVSELIGQKTIPVIKPGEAADINVSWYVAYTANTVRYIGIEVDPLNQIPEWNEEDNFDFVEIEVNPAPDLVIGPSGIYSIPSKIPAGIAVILYAEIKNAGDNSTPSIPFFVDFYYDNTSNLIGSYLVTNILSPGSSLTANVTWNNPVDTDADGSTKLIVEFNKAMSIVEKNYANNYFEKFVTIYTQPDLVIDNLVCIFEGEQVGPADSVPADLELTFVIYVKNLGGADVIASPSKPVMLRLLIGDDLVNATPLTDAYAVITSTIAGASTISKEITYTPDPIDVPSQDYTIWAVINPNASQGGYATRAYESNYDNNYRSFDLTVYDSRPDLAVFKDDIGILVDGVEVVNISYADTIVVMIRVYNLGYLPVEEFEINVVMEGNASDPITSGVSRTIKAELLTIEGSSFEELNYYFMVTVNYSGDYIIRVTLDEVELIEDRNRSNNEGSIDLYLRYIEPSITIEDPLPNADVQAGQLLSVSGIVRFPETAIAMANVEVFIAIRATGATTNIIQAGPFTTNVNGFFSGNIQIPEELGGSHQVIVTVGANEVARQVNIVGEAFEWWLWALIFGAAAAAILIFVSILVFRRGLGKLVECGECGALIPESARRCPKCGVEFEEEMVKCSECGAWIPATALECPNCHVRFGTPPEEEKGYEDKMREQYEKTILTKYRDLAKVTLGAEYNEDTFEGWWKANPAYISFEDWLAKEEEKRKAVAAVVKCKVCGTPNARGSTVCHKCGSPIEAEVEAEVFARPKRPPEKPPEDLYVEKRVIRKPIDRKVVPKKIIKKPLDEEEE